MSTSKIDLLREEYKKKVAAFTALQNSIPQLQAELKKIKAESATTAEAGNTDAYLRLQDDARIIEGKIHVATAAKNPTVDYEKEALPAWNEFKKSRDKNIEKLLSDLTAARRVHVDALMAVVDAMSELVTMRVNLAQMTGRQIWEFKLGEIAASDGNLLKAEEQLLRLLRPEGDTIANRFRTVMIEHAILKGGII